MRRSSTGRAVAGHYGGVHPGSKVKRVSADGISNPAQIRSLGVGERSAVVCLVVNSNAIYRLSFINNLEDHASILFKTEQEWTFKQLDGCMNGCFIYPGLDKKRSLGFPMLTPQSLWCIHVVIVAFCWGDSLRSAPYPEP
jgi:hypothetical protein